MANSLSIVTPCCNDIEPFLCSLRSVGRELEAADELVVIDSSEDRRAVPLALEQAVIRCPVTYRWIPPSGVYAALNRGITESTREWVQLLCSGDELCDGARSSVANACSMWPATVIHVFRGRAVTAKGTSYTFSPTGTSVWPSQSVVMRRSVYEQEGLYSEEYRFAADQMYFARLRHSQPWRLQSFVLTIYPLGGRSSTIRFFHLRDAYAVRRALGQHRPRAIVGAFVLPVLRRGLEALAGEDIVAVLKRLVFTHYSRG